MRVRATACARNASKKVFRRFIAFAGPSIWNRQCEDIALIDEAADYAYDEIVTLDVRTLQKLHDYYRDHADKLFEIALKDIVGNQVMVVKKSEFRKMLSEGKVPENAKVRSV